MKKSDILELNDSVFKYENFFNIYENEKNLRFFNLLKNISIFGSKDSQIEEEYITTGADTWYSISHKMYGTVNLWWLVCLYNETINPIKPINKEKTLKVIKPQYVSIVLSEIKKQLN